MPKEKSRGGGGAAPEIETPDRALERLREDAEEERRRLLARAAVEVSGELGYRRLTVALITERSGGAGRTSFYRCFADRGEAWLAGYRLGIEELCEDLLDRGREAEDWTAGLRAALGCLARFLAAEPAYAAGLIAQVHVAGGAASDKRKEVLERLSCALGSARRETHPSRHSPPPIASEFILNAIEQSAIRAIGRRRPEEFARTAPELLHLAVATYLGPEAAGRL